MTSDSDWLYQYLLSEAVRDEERERWNSLISRWRPLTAIEAAEKLVCNHCEVPNSGVMRDRQGQSVLSMLPRGRGRQQSKREIMNAGELGLASLAAALVGDTAQLSVPESRLVASTDSADSSLVDRVREKIAAGVDILGTEFCAIRSARQRRECGATYTPPAIVDAMVAWAGEEGPVPARVIDPGSGSGRFLVAAAHRFPAANLIGVEVDPLAALMLRANAAVQGFADRLSVHVLDYRQLSLPKIEGPTLFIGNPPYVRHHDIEEQWKTWFAETASRYGVRASKLAGLHIHFFFKTRELAQAGDYGAFITAAEWLDVNYGSVLRTMLADGLGGTAVHIIDPRAQPFADALTTGAITCFRVGSRPTHVTMRSVSSLDELAPLGRGRPVAWHDITEARKWSVFVNERDEAPAGFVELGEMFRVHRGQVTGSNGVWIDGDAAREVPKTFKPITITSARELLNAGTELTSTARLRRVVDLPADLDVLDENERKAVERFLAWARCHGAHESYIARHRRAWWSVGLRDPAPILCTYMARRPPAFVRNRVKARHINIAHGLYPREPLSDEATAAVLAWLNSHVGTAGGRTYAGGLVKFEPRELERLLLPRLEDIHGYLGEAAPEALDACGAGIRRGGREGRLSQ